MKVCRDELKGAIAWLFPRTLNRGANVFPQPPEEVCPGMRAKWERTKGGSGLPAGPCGPRKVTEQLWIAVRRLVVVPLPFWTDGAKCLQPSSCDNSRANLASR